MKKLIFTFVSMFIGVVGFAATGNGLLWKVSGKNLSKPSYILGSHHMAPSQFIDSIAGLKDAIISVDAVYGEVHQDSLQSPAAQQMMMAHATAPADSTLSKILTPRELALTDSVPASFIGQPGMIMQFEPLKPAFVGIQLALLQIMKAMPEMSAIEPFDVGVMSFGKQAGKEIGGLETVDGQLHMILGDPISVQKDDFMKSVVMNDKQIEQALLLTKAYLAQDLDKVTEITTDPEYGIEAEQLERLIYKRNRAWVAELERLLPQKSLFLVVGAGHLGGEQGVLNLLAQKGYTVECVSAK